MILALQQYSRKNSSNIKKKTLYFFPLISELLYSHQNLKKNYQSFKKNIILALCISSANEKSQQKPLKKTHKCSHTTFCTVEYLF